MLVGLRQPISSTSASFGCDIDLLTSENSAASLPCGMAHTISSKKQGNKKVILSLPEIKNVAKLSLRRQVRKAATRSVRVTLMPVPITY